MTQSLSYGPNHRAVEELLRKYLSLSRGEIIGLAEDWRALHGVVHHEARLGRRRSRRSLARLTQSERSRAWERLMSAAERSERAEACDRLRDNILILMRMGAVMRRFDEEDSLYFTDAGNAAQDAALALLLEDVIDREDFVLLTRPWNQTSVIGMESR